MDPDDPWHWSLDRVVQELCTPDRSWQIPPSIPIPDLPELAAALREQGISGCLLLLYVDENTLRIDFNYKTVRQRAFIQAAITELRRQSPLYQDYISRDSNRGESVSLHTPTDGPYMSSASPGPSSGQYQGKQGTAHVTQTSLQSPVSQSHTPQPETSGGLSPDNEIPRLTTDSLTTNEGESSSKRRKLEHTFNDIGDEIFEDTPPIRSASTNRSEVEESSNVQVVPPLGQVDKQTTNDLPGLSTKRKRIAPTLISTDVDVTRDRQIPTEADSVLHNNPEIIEPGVPFVADDGRKRLVPIRQTNLDSEPYDYNQLLQQSKPRQTMPTDKPSDKVSDIKKTGQRRGSLRGSRALLSNNSYLGKQKMTVDDLFYAGTAVGQELSAPEDPGTVSLRPAKLPGGQRLYVHRMMKGYLRAEPTTFERDNSLFYAVRPYPSKLTPRFHSPSFTLFHVDHRGKVCAKREEVPRWPEIGPGASLQKLGAGGNGQVCSDLGLGILSEVGSHATFDPDSLIKYQYFHGADEILPIYGESDEENEYDLDTWKEMEEERGALQKPVRQMRKSPISLEDVNDAIDEAISELVVKWRRVQFPKKQQKAFRIWTKFRKNRQARRDHIDEVQKQLDRIDDDRIPKLRKGILDEAWSSRAQVKQQARIMEQSIFDRQSSIWEINLLKSRVIPEKPTPNVSALSTKSASHAQKDCDDGESIGTSSDGALSDNEMDDFVVEDASEEIEMDLADTEDGQDGSSDSKSAHSSESESCNQPPRKTGALQTSTADPVVKDETLLADALPTLPNNAGNPIDLTILSSDETPETPTINLITPKKKQKVTLIHRRNPFAGSPIPISDEEVQLPDLDNLPSYDDPEAIAAFPHHAWANIFDRERLLISVFKEVDEKLKAAMFTFISSITEDELWHHMLSVVSEPTNGHAGLKGIDDATVKNLREFIRLFLIYAECKYRSAGLRTNSRFANLPDEDKEMFPGFYLFFQKLEGYFSESADNLAYEDKDDSDEDPVIRSRRSRNAISPDSEIEEPISQKTKHKRKIFEDKEARDMREKDRQRLAEQDERRKKLQQKLPSLQYSDGQRKIIINDGKYEDQGFVYVAKDIAPCIKQHQIDGVRFMWSQIVTGKQGCLLAHTMGLGKTMQVITLLCAIADASKSPDESVRSQIPVKLRLSRTLVLCPAGLIDNWMDELLLWGPKGLLGEFRKLNSPTKDRELVRTIKDWFNSGGVLLVGYERFRILFENKKTEKREARFGEDEHEKIKRYLLEGPNIIIADEAHKMKNASTGLAKSTKLFESKSRIALTGSPLANNVEEYHTMIDWIALNYLGPADEFRAKYAEPIQAGLWNDSSGTDRRQSLKMLRVLGHDLAPKVHRADMTVLRNDLPPKKEFVITVPLTDLQQKAYTIYVQSMVSGTAHTTKDGEFTQTTLWNWLAILSLLCNHPDCFNQKLHERQDAARKEQNAQKSISGTDQEENISTDLNTPIWKIGVSPELVNKVTELFQQETNNLKAPDLSYKVKILFQILDRSKAVGDKVLVFSQSIPTLNYVESLCTSQHRKYFRLDGSTPIPKRQEMIKKFNVGDTDIALISTAAGGLGLNITGANRVVIFDFKYNPIMEEQAVGRAYRIGQKKEVFVYRLIAGGTFEDSMHNKAVFKTQLASRVVDKKNPVAWARKGLKEMLFEPKVVEQKDLSGFVGMDRLVLDEILASQATCSTIRGIVQTDTFEQDSNDKLTAEEEMEVQQLIMDKDMRRSNPAAFNAIIEQRNSAERNRLMGMGMTAQLPRKRGSNSKGSNSKASMYAVPPLPIIPTAAPRQEPSNPTAAALLPPPPVHATGPVAPLHPSNPTAIATPLPGATDPGDGQLKGLSHLPRTEKHPGNNTTAVQPSHAATSGSSITGTTASPTVDELAPSNPAENPIPSQVTKPSPVVAPLSSGNSTSSNGGLGNIEQSAMFKAMNRAPAARSLRTPVANYPASGRKQTQYSTENSFQIPHAIRSRMSSSASPQEMRRMSSSSPKIPKWAKSEIMEASRSLSQRRASHKSPPSKI